jgi:glutaredoxin
MIRVYGYDDCPFCQKAKKLLTEEGLEYDYVEIPSKEGRTMFLDQRGFKPPHRTFPRTYVLVDGEEKLIGGYDDLELYVVLTN